MCDIEKSKHGTDEGMPKITFKFRKFRDLMVLEIF